jgi:hypothetical protein
MFNALNVVVGAHLWQNNDGYGSDGDGGGGDGVVVLMVTAGMAMVGTSEKVAKVTEANTAKMYRRTREVEFHLPLNISQQFQPRSIAWSSFWFFWPVGGDSHGGGEARGGCEDEHYGGGCCCG